MNEAGSQFFSDEEELVRCFETGGILVIVLDEKNVIKYINRKGCEFLGYERIEVEGLDWEEFIHPEDRSLFKSLLRDITEAKITEYKAIEGRILTNDGTYRNLLWHNLVIFGEDDEVFQIVSIGEDIEEKKNLEINFSLKNKAVETSINGILISDMNASIVYANPSFAKMHGYDSADEVIGMNASEFFQDPVEMKNMFGELIQTGKFQGDTTIRKKDGDRIIDQASVFLIRLDGGDESFMVVSMVDVTDREKITKALTNANKKLNILSGVTRHDILNEVTVASGYLELTGDASPEEKKEYINKALIAINRIKRDAVFSRDYQDLGIYSPEWQNPQKIVEDFIVSGSGYENIDINLDIGNIEIYADPMLPKVFANILSNSVIHGKHVTKITISSSKSDSGSFIISIEDNGIGIPENIRDSLFKPALGRNHGFGLYLVKEILSITGIEIFEDGTPGEGARFEIIVPPENWRKRC